MKIRTVCAASVLFGEEAFSELGDVIVLPDKEITADVLSSADALVTRSKTRMDQVLLEGSRVSFCGTATAGFDHMDTRYLESAGLAWVSAPGCNAPSVRDYVMVGLLCLARRHHLLLEGRTMAVIGVGQVGSRVAASAEALGMNIRLNDPPLADRTGDLRYEPLADVLSEADVVTLHVPLTTDGRYATENMVDCRFFSQLKPGCVFINASRGGVVDERALMHAMDSDVVSHAMLDVWQKEPYLDPALVDRVDIATPHIAGYSMEGKLAGTMAVYKDACHFFEREATWIPPELPHTRESLIELDARGQHDEDVLWQMTRCVYDIEEDDRNLRSDLKRDDANACAAHFVRLRIDYPVRREFSCARGILHHADEALIEKAKALGFELVTDAGM